jgi:hypothetical protein
VTPLAQDGATVVFAGWDAQIEGNVLHGATPDLASPTRLEFALTVASGDLCEGPVFQYVGGAVQDEARMRLRRRAAPTGVFSLSGSTPDGPLDHECHTAYATRHEATEVGDRDSLTVVDAEAQGARVLRIWNASGIWILGSHAYDVPGELEVSYGAQDWFVEASAGSVTLSTLAPGRVVGSFVLSLEGGGTLTGVVDAPILFSD